MNIRFIIVPLFSILLTGPAGASTPKVEDLFYHPYEQLLEKVALDSPLFATAEEVRDLIERPDEGDRVLRLARRIAVARMLLVDGQLQPEKKVSCRFAQVTASRLVTAGEKWILIAQAKNSDSTYGPQGSKSGDGEEPTVNEAQKEPEGGKVVVVEKRRRDNRFDIFDDDEFNLFDVLAFPFRLVEMVLELLFDILLFPFKLISQVLF